MEQVYCDYAATTPVDPRVVKAMKPYVSVRFGNPGSLHRFGQDAIAAVDKARETIAHLIGAEFREVIFTSSATEANNMALRGAVTLYRAEHPDALLSPRIIVSAIEHESVLETARALKQYGVDIVEVPVDKNGRVDVNKIEQAITPSTVVVSVMYANNEIGTVQPISEIGAMIQKWRADKNAAERDAGKKVYPLFHTDASQAFQFLDCTALRLGVDMMTLSSQKVYGPKGVGVLYANKGITLVAQVTGGGQEFGLRSGTENVPAIVGCAEAFKLTSDMRDAEVKRQRTLAESFAKQLMKQIPQAKPNGFPANAGLEKRLPNILNFYIPGYDAADLVMQCDLLGLAISSGSACASRSYVPSYVLRALGQPVKRASESIRISIGRPTTKADITTAIRIIRKSVTA